MLVLSSCGKYNIFTVFVGNCVDSYFSILGHPSSGYVQPAYGVDPLTALMQKGRQNRFQIRFITIHIL
jgi:hypothetical protein